MDYSRLAASLSDAELQFLSHITGWTTIDEAAAGIRVRHRKEILTMVLRLHERQVILFDDPEAADELAALAAEGRERRRAPRGEQARPAPGAKQPPAVPSAPPTVSEAAVRPPVEPTPPKAPDPVFAEIWSQVPKLNLAVDYAQLPLTFTPGELQFLSRLTGWSSVRGASLGVGLTDREVERFVARLAAHRVVLFDDLSLALRLIDAYTAEEREAAVQAAAAAREVEQGPRAAENQPLDEARVATEAQAFAQAAEETWHEGKDRAAFDANDDALFEAAAKPVRPPSAATPRPRGAHDGAPVDSGRWDVDALFALINRLRREGRTGVLRVFRDPQTYKAVYFAQGGVINALSVPFRVEECLGRLLQRAGHINQEKVLESIRRAKQSGARQGEELMKMGAVRRDLIQEMLRVQVEVKLTDVFEWGSGVWTFRPLPSLPARIAPIDVRLPRLLFNLIWKRYPQERIEAEVQRRLEMYVGRADEPVYDPADFDFGDSLDKFWRIVSEKDNTLKRLMIVSNLKPEQTERMVWTLHLTGMVGFFADTREDKLATRLEGWKNQLKVVERETLFDVLHVHWTADDRMIEDAYRRRVKDIDEAAAQATELELELIKELRKHTEQAYQALRTRVGRRDYRAKIFDDEFILFGADILRMKGESYLFTKDAPDLAAVELETALEVYDRNGEYYAALGLANFLRFYPRNSRQVEAARDLMRKGLKMSPQSEVSHLCLGMLHRHEGQQKKAMEALQKVLEINPNNRFARIVIQEIKTGKTSDEREDAIKEFIERKGQADEGLQSADPSKKGKTSDGDASA
jgi:tetratricopeptide (TPR) repeat protein